jgi:peroxiredoxin
MLFGKMQALSLGILALSAALLIGNHDAAKAAAGIKDIKDRQAAPNFQLTDSNGNWVRLSDFKGKVVLLNFWAIWSGPGKAEIPWFEEFENTYKSGGLTILGLAMDDDGWSAVRPFMARIKMNHRVMLGDDATASKYGGVEIASGNTAHRRARQNRGQAAGLTARATYEQAIGELVRQ